MTDAERDAEFDKAIAPLTRQQFSCLPHDMRKPAWNRYLARINTLEEDDQAAVRQFYKSTGPTPRCWKQGCEEPCEVDSWYCSEHTNHDPAPVAERVQWAKLGWRIFLLIILGWLAGFIIGLAGVMK